VDGPVSVKASTGPPIPVIYFWRFRPQLSAVALAVPSFAWINVAPYAVGARKGNALRRHGAPTSPKAIAASVAATAAFAAVVSLLIIAGSGVVDVTEISVVSSGSPVVLRYPRVVDTAVTMDGG
jgi:hypothetical protein